MKQWPKVAWSDAGQILTLMEADPEVVGGDAADPTAEPHSFFEALVAAGRLRDAADFIGHALPRYEGIVWAAQTLLAQNAIERASPLVVAILRWIDNPSDERRREVWSLAEAARPGDPARLLGTAVFMSGGSISEPDLPPVLAPQSVSPRLAAAAVISAAYASVEPNSVLRHAIEVGRQTASQGV